MNQIKAKFGTIMVLLLVVVMFIPAASSKYVTSGTVKSITLNTSLEAPYANIIYTTSVGNQTPSISQYDSKKSTTSGGLVTLSNLETGYYFIAAKGGDGGDGLNKDSGAGGAGKGGLVSGVIQITDTSKKLLIYLATSGESAAEGSSTKSGGVNSFARIIDGRSYDMAHGGTGSAYNGGTATYYAASGAGGGAATWIFDTDTSAGSKILMIGAGGGGGAATGSGSALGDGGRGGNLFQDSKTTQTWVPKGDIVYGGSPSNNTDVSGMGATNKGGSGSNNSGSGSAYAFGSYTGSYSGAGGNSTYGSGVAANDSGSGGGGGGGYAGGGAGSGIIKNWAYRYAGGGGGGSSFIADDFTVSTLSSHNTYMNAFFTRCGITNRTYDSSTTGILTHLNGAKLSSYVIIYYIGETL